MCIYNVTGYNPYDDLGCWNEEDDDKAQDGKTITDLQKCIEGLKSQLQAMQKQNMCTLQRIYALEMQQYRHLFASDSLFTPQNFHMPSMEPAMSIPNVMTGFQLCNSPASTDYASISASPRTVSNKSSNSSCSVVDSASSVVPKDPLPSVDKSHPKASSPSITDSATCAVLKEEKVPLQEKVPLPPIDKSTLIDPQDVVEKYRVYLKRSRLTRLAVRLAKEAYFGEKVMEKCTVQGIRHYNALPRSELNDLKKFMLDLSLPRFVDTRGAFEILWKDCVISIGQACKNLRDQSSGSST